MLGARMYTALQATDQPTKRGDSSKVSLNHPALDGYGTDSLIAIVNDYVHHETFVQQVRAPGRPGDVSVGLSASGNSAKVDHSSLHAKASCLRWR